MRKLVFILFVFLSYLLFRPVLGDVWYTMHDTTHIARTYLLEKTLASGQIPALWSAELLEGRGYPLFHFYAPLTYYLALLFKFVTGSYFLGLKTLLIIASLTGMTGMYFLTRRHGRASGIVASVAYAFLPYAAVNLYVRGAFAEYLAMALLPWVFYCWTKLTTTKEQLLAGVVTAVFLLSHNLIPLITAPFLLGWILLHRGADVKHWLLPVFLTLALAAFYLIPLLFERSFVQADSIAQTTAYSLHFVAPSQIWNSTWGFGGSAPGVEDGMSFKLGKLQLILAGLGAFLALVKRRKQEIFFVIAALLAFFMTTQFSDFLWHNFPVLKIVQFPWRFLALLGFFAAVLTGYSLSFLKVVWLRTTASVLIVLGLLFLNLKLFVPQLIYPADLTRFTSRDYLSTIPTIVPEFAPRWLIGGNPVIKDSTILSFTYYPTWEVTLDGKKVATYPSEDGSLAFTNVSRSANYSAVQTHTLLETISSLVSLFGLIVLIKLYVQT